MTLRYRSKSVDLAGITFVARSNDESLIASVERAFSSCIGVRPTQATPMRIDLTRSEGRVELRWGNSREYFGSPAAVLGGLVSLSNRLSLDHDDTYLHLHAGAVDSSGRAVLVTAPSGGGKTTLTAALAHRGARYMTDETVALQGSGSQIVTWPKPLSIKATGRDLITKMLDQGCRTQVFGDAPSPTELGFDVSCVAEPTAIAFLHPGPPLPAPSPGEAVVLLVEQTMDYERYGPRGLLLLAQLAARCSLLRVHRQAPLSMAEKIARLIEPNDRPTPEEIVLPAAVDHAPEAPRPAVQAVRLGNELVVRNTATGVIGCVRHAMADHIEAHGHSAGLSATADDETLRQLDLLLGICNE